MIDLILQLYSWVVFAHVIASWLIAFNVINARNEFIRVILSTLYRLTEPVLGVIRRYLPNLGGVDLSAIVLLLGLFFARSLLREYYGTLFIG